MDDPPPPLLRIQTTLPTSSTPDSLNSNRSGRGTPPRTSTRSPPPLAPLPFSSSANNSNSNSPAHSSNGGGSGGSGQSLSCHPPHPHLSPDIVSAGKFKTVGGGALDKSTDSSSDDDSEFDERERRGRRRVPRFKGFDNEDTSGSDEREDEDDSSELESDNIFMDMDHPNDRQRPAQFLDQEANNNANRTLNWNSKDLGLLYKILVLNGKRPVGMNKHFTMMSVRSTFAKESKSSDVSSDLIWSHLRSLYNLKELDEADNPEDSPLLCNREFSLPDSSDFIHLIKQFSTTAGTGTAGAASNLAGNISLPPKLTPQNQTPSLPSALTTPLPPKRMIIDDDDIDITKLGAPRSQTEPKKIFKA